MDDRALMMVSGLARCLDRRRELGQRSGYEAGGGIFRTYLPKLKRLRLGEERFQ